MSADNYYVVRKHPDGGYTYVMGFDSNPEPDREAREDDQQFDTVWDAVWDAASLDPWVEYGVTFHHEVTEDLRQAVVQKSVDGSLSA